MTEIEKMIGWYLQNGGKITKEDTRPMKKELMYNQFAFAKSSTYARGRQKAIFDRKTNRSYAAESHI